MGSCIKILLPIKNLEKFRIDCLLIDAEGKHFRASIYLAMEIIVAGALTLLSLPFFCDRKKPSRSSDQGLSRSQIQRENSTLIVPECSLPPKYEDLFPLQVTV